MAIFFGDELKSSNSDYPIIDIAENNAKGVVFVDLLAEFTAVNIPEPKITKGVVVVDRANGDVYIYTAGFTNSDGAGGTTTGNNNVDTETTAPELTDFFSLGLTASANWKVIGNTPVFGADIYANIGTIGDQANGVKRSFGKYEDGDLVPTSTKTALEVIKDALTSYQEFIASDIDDVSGGTAVDFTYDISARTGQAVNDRKFRIKNRNRNSISGDNTSPVAYGIQSIQVDRVVVDAEVNIGKIYWDGSAWVRTGVLDTADTQTRIGTLNSFTASPSTFVNFEFDDSVDLSARLAGDGTQTGKYKIIVQAVDNTGEEQGHTTDGQPGVPVELIIGDTNSGRFNVIGYQRPEVTLTPSIGDTSQSGTAITDSATIRSLGNVDSNFTLSVQKQNATTTIDSIRVYRGTNTSGVLLHSIVTGTAGTGEVLIDATQNGATQPEVDYTFKDYLDASGVTGYGSVGAVIPSADVSSIAYTVEITDNGGTSASNDESYTSVSSISFKIPYFAGTSSVNPSTSSASTLETIISGGSFLKRANSQTADFFFQVAPSASSSTTATNADVFVPNSIDGTSDFCYVCIPNNGTLTDIVINGAEPAISEFGGASGKTSSVVTFSNSVTRTYRVYGNGQPGAQGGNTLDLQP